MHQIQRFTLSDRAELIADQAGLPEAAAATAHAAVARLAHVEPADVRVMERDPQSADVGRALDIVRDVARMFVAAVAVQQRTCSLALVLELERVAEQEARFALEAALIAAFGPPVIEVDQDDEPAGYRPAARLAGAEHGEFEGRPLLECGACGGSGGAGGALGCRFCGSTGMVSCGF